MPIGPNGERRPQSDTACAVHVMKIATGEIEEKRAPRLPRKQGRVIRRSSEEPPEQLTMIASSRPPHFVTTRTGSAPRPKP